MHIDALALQEVRALVVALVACAMDACYPTPDESSPIAFARIRTAVREGSQLHPTSRP